MVSSCFLWFHDVLGLIRGKQLPAGLHAVEGSYVSALSLSAFRAAIVRAVWSCNMLLGNTPAILTLLDGPVGVDPAYYIVRAKFRMMRRCLACRPDEVHGDGHGPVHLRLSSATEIGFAWDGGEQGCVRAALPPLWMLSVQPFAGAIQTFSRLFGALMLMSLQWLLRPFVC